MENLHGRGEVVVVSSQALTRGKSGLCDTQLILHCR